MSIKKNKGKVLLGLSGGVDSSVAAILLKNKGYEVIGAFMKNYSNTKDPLTNKCHYLEDKKMAQRIASILNIKFITIDSEKEYKNKIIKPLVEEYKRGKTPNPDISCNTIIKFPILRKYAILYKCNFIATGHYARIKKNPNGFSLLRGKDLNKDQSYFLSELSQKDLAHTFFPIGYLKKEEVRRIAKKYKLPNWDKKGTSGICFVGKINMKTFLKSKIKNNPGKIKSPTGEILGYHPGIHYFTIGERIGPSKKIFINSEYQSKKKKKLYIAQIKKNNTIVVVPENHATLKQKNIKIKKLKKINPKEKIPKIIKIRIRHLGKLYSGNLRKSGNRYIFNLKIPIEKPAPGQEATLYHNQELIAAGEIY